MTSPPRTNLPVYKRWSDAKGFANLAAAIRLHYLPAAETSPMRLDLLPLLPHGVLILTSSEAMIWMYHNCQIRKELPFSICAEISGRMRVQRPRRLES